MKNQSVEIDGRIRLFDNCYTGELKSFTSENKCVPLKLYQPAGSLLDIHKKFSYDKDTGNVHMFPAAESDASCGTGTEDIASKYAKDIDNKSTPILSCLKKAKKQIGHYDEISFRLYRGKNTLLAHTIYENTNAINLFSYIKASVNNRSYNMMLIRFDKQRIAYGSNDITAVNCTLKCLQFEMSDSKLRAVDIYPDSAETGAVSSGSNGYSNNYYYNPHASFYDCEETIATEFLNFIAQNEARLKKDEIYIVRKSALSARDKHLLKLNRDTQVLEVFEKIGNEEACSCYSLRKDFDASEYSSYKRQNVFSCIFGGWQKPTPKGVFRVEAKSENEYISSYYPNRGKVKFFGYLVLFEDYFIHSNLYEDHLTKDILNTKNSITAIGIDDVSTSGCIRVAQKDLDWLLETIEIGTTVIL